MLEKIISGGQTGVDRIGLEVGKLLNIKTGGTAPNGYLTENGSDLSLMKYGLLEHSSDKYPPRTKCNVVDSDGTVYYSTSLNSRGCKLTKRLCDDNEKPFIYNPSINELIDFIKDYDIKTLNIAGNRGSKLTLKQQENVKNLLINSIKGLNL